LKVGFPDFCLIGLTELLTRLPAPPSGSESSMLLRVFLDIYPKF